jgi:serine/threonine protein kinase
MKAPAAGVRISNYVLDECIGSGTFGQVWRAHHHVFNDVVAIKLPTNPQYVRNLRQEGVTAHTLKHPNIVAALDLDPHADPPYYVMEYVDGPSLRSIIEVSPDGMPVEDVFAVMEGLLTALDVAHRAGVIHRDVKPANILIAGGNTSQRITAAQVKVTDFGLGSITPQTTVSILQSTSLAGEEEHGLSGTIAYMSPEQRDGGEVDARSDLYACGIVLFEMLTGTRPAGSELPSQVREDVPEAIDAVFQRLYTRKERRYSSAGDALKALSGIGRRRRAGGAKAPPITGRRVRRSGRWYCAACDGWIGQGDQFCMHCGAQLVEEVPRCGHCDAYVHAEDRFCIFCGARLEVATP